MAKPVDLELKKAFKDLQKKMAQTSEIIEVIDSQMHDLFKILPHAHVVQREINQLPPGTQIYQSIGRMFVLTDDNVMRNNLKNRVSDMIVRATELENNKKYLAKNLKESEANIREMVQQRRHLEGGCNKP